MYDPTMVQPMRDEVVELGFVEAKSAQEVDAALTGFKGTAFIFVNSVCGCAAGGARPALRIALQNAAKRPDKLLTVFAGMERDATTRAREYFTGYAPSSPCMGLLKDGEVVHMIERHHIEGQMPEAIARSLAWAFEQYC
jgi:putative YphP/YqiW family bacilliredoxin